MKVTALIGARAHERNKKQPLIIDATIQIDISKAIENDHIASTVDYSMIVQEILNFSKAANFYLLESFAYHLANEILKKFSIKNILLHILKPQATNGLADISIEYSQSACF